MVIEAKFHGSNIRLRVGREFLGENDQKGSITRSADLSGIGDHLISWESDARATYAAKIDVLPLRLKGTTQN